MVLDPRRVSVTSLALAAGAAVAWVATIGWARAGSMGAMPGTMGTSLVAFTFMWGLMIAAMMLPSVTPFVGAYQATAIWPSSGRAGPRRSRSPPSPSSACTSSPRSSPAA
jgi:hypothetical protein